MKKILFMVVLSLSLMVCFTSPTWASALDDVQAGIAAVKEGDYDKGIELCTKAIASGELSELDRIFAQACLIGGYYNRGNACGKKGDYDKAIADYTKAIEIYPQHADAYFMRGLAWEMKGDYSKAFADYNKTIKINPKYAAAYNQLAWLMATCPEGRYRDGKRAVEFAKKAVALEDDAGFLDTLAAAYAEVGRFQEAIKTQERAITKLKQEAGTIDLPEFEQHLSSYKAGKPWREK